MNTLNSALTFVIHLTIRIGMRAHYCWRWMGKLQMQKPTTWRPPPCSGVPREHKLTREEFVRKYLKPQLPVIVSGSIDDWAAMKAWTPEFFVENFGDMKVKLQSSTFDTMDKTTLKEFINDQFCGTPKPNDPHKQKAPNDVSSLNLRYVQPSGILNDFKKMFGWYHLLGDEHFGVRAFQKLTDFWKAPSFLPWGGYSFPWTIFKAEQPNHRWFHDWGIYMSPRNTVTRMHIDGSRTHAVLCMISGQKKCYMMPPSCEAWFEPVYAIGDDPNHRHAEPCFQDCPQSMKDKLPMQAFECTINAGDVLFVPKNWLHEVHTTQPSVMITYNFLHGVRELCETVVLQIWRGYAATVFLNK